MQQIILDGKKLSTEIEDTLKKEVATILQRTGVQPVLATILVGDDPSSRIYVNMKARACNRIGLKPRIIELGVHTATEELVSVIETLNTDPEVFGILLQHPVPRQIDERKCFDCINIKKDVDGVTSSGFGKMALGEESFVSATPGGILRLLKHYNITLTGKKAVVLGRSAILGKPIAMLLLNENATVTICHSKTENIDCIVQNADIVVAAVGLPHFVKKEWIKEGAVIIDAGYHPGGIGDVEKEAFQKASTYTPVPGGVGPMTIATLLYQTVEAAKRDLLLCNRDTATVT